MRRYNYPQSFATGVIAAGGTLGAMLPPSTVLAVYGIITEQDIGKLFIAEIIPGLLAATMDMLTVVVIGRLRPDFLPAAPRHTWKERLTGLRDIWAMLLLFVFVIGGLYGGLFTPTEAGGVGATGALLIGVLRGRLTRVGNPPLVAAGGADGGRGAHRADRRAAVRLFPHRDADAAERQLWLLHPHLVSAATASWR